MRNRSTTEPLLGSLNALTPDYKGEVLPFHDFNTLLTQLLVVQKLSLCTDEVYVVRQDEYYINIL